MTIRMNIAYSTHAHSNQKTKMFLLLKILPVLGCFADRVLSERNMDECVRCEENFCPKAKEECPRGMVRDPCGCCPSGVCVLAERDKCFNGNYRTNFSESGMRKYGSCGEYMECILRSDLGPNDRSEFECVCRHVESVCGSNNATYDSLCEMRSAKADLLHYGPCLTKPVVVSGPQVSRTYEGSTFAVDCEAKGFPVPSIIWEFHSFTGTVTTLPGDDSTIIVHSRGGPENYMLTSWLQIESLRKNDSGRYVCIARNSEGEDRAMTFVQVSVYNL